MFLSSSQARERVRYIIEDDVDNDIVFVVAHKGIGKTVFLRDVCDMNPYNSGYIVVDGSRVKGNAPSLKKCFADGILEYIIRNNIISNREIIRQRISKFLSAKDKVKLLIRRVDIDALGRALCHLSLNELKEIYFDIAGSTPLVIVSKAMSLTNEEVQYLKSLPNDNFGSVGSRITFVIGIRAEPSNLEVLGSIIKMKQHGIWIMPLLPEITALGIKNDPRSFSSISIQKYGEVDNSARLNELVTSSDVYLATFELAKKIAKTNLNPVQVFILARQDASLKNYKFIQDITETIYNKTPRYDNRIILPNNGKLLWLDVVSYFLVLQDGIDEAINCTQDFFLKIICDYVHKPKRYSFGTPKRKELTSFINEISSTNSNALANGFAQYYSDFAMFVKVFYLKKRRTRRYTYTKSISVAEVLGRVALFFSEDCINVLNEVHGRTQTCYFLDIGVETIKYFLSDAPSEQSLPESTKEVIRRHLSKTLLEAYRWNDITLAENIVEFFSLIKDKKYDLRLKPVLDIIRPKNNTVDIDVLLDKYNVTWGDIFMPIKKVFLSYNHSNKAVAIKIDTSLTNAGHEIIRDEKHLKTFDSLKSFMKTIRKYEFVILLVSDSYFKSDNCMYEVTQFLKDEEYKDKAIPVVVDFSDEEKETRKKNGEASSLFSLEYRLEVVSFWNSRARYLDKQIKELDTQNTVELAKSYREILKMSESVSVFLEEFLNEDLLPVVKSDNSNLSIIIDEIQKRMLDSLI